MKKKQGFACLDREKHKEISDRGRTNGARKGGLIISANQDHMKEIGRRGGIASAATRRKKG